MLFLAGVVELAAAGRSGSYTVGCLRYTHPQGKRAHAHPLQPPAPRAPGRRVDTEQGWRITAATYTVERDGCAESPLGPLAVPASNVTSSTDR